MRGDAGHDLGAPFQIDRADLALFRFTDDPAGAVELLKKSMTEPVETRTPDIAHSTTTKR